MPIRQRVLTVLSMALALVCGSFAGRGALAAQGAPGAAGFDLRVVVVGRAPADAGVDVAVLCRSTAGTPRPGFSTRIAPGALRSILPQDITGLAADDACSVTATGIDGAQLSYATSQPARADGSVPDVLRGVVDGGAFRSAFAPADGRTVTVTVTYVGDLLVRKVVEGVSGSTVGLYEIQIRCDGGGPVRTVLLGDGQSTLVPNVPTGSVCTVDESRADGAAPRFDDNSGHPNDGRVTIVATPKSCWDLRATGPDCRAVVTVTNRFRSTLDVLNEQVSSAPTTTSPDDRNDRNDDARNPATTAAPAVTAEPASAVSAEPTFTG